MQHLRELIDMGFAPYLALVIVVVIVLWATLCGVVIFGFRLFLKDRTDRDSLRREQLAELDERLTASEEQHKECDTDRKAIHKTLRDLERKVARFEACGKTDCPMRK